MPALKSLVYFCVLSVPRACLVFTKILLFVLPNVLMSEESPKPLKFQSEALIHNSGGSSSCTLRVKLTTYFHADIRH